MVTNAEAITSALGYYLSALEGTVDAQYLLVTAALEAILPAASAEAGIQRELASPDVWARITGTLNSIATQEGIDGHGLASALESARIMPLHAALAGLAKAMSLVVPGLLEEFEQLPKVRSRGLISTIEGRNIFRDVNRVELLKTMLVSAVATASGYGGPIWYHHYDDDGSRQNTTVLVNSKTRESTETAATEAFIAQTTILPPADGMWPDFSRPSSASGTLVSRIVEFGEVLRSRTDGLVMARVQPSATANEDSFEFVILVVDNPEVQSILMRFTSTSEGHLVVSDLDDRASSIEIGSGPELEALLSRIARSDSTRERILRMVTFARSVQRP
jgi:hypothetical protein